MTTGAPDWMADFAAQTADLGLLLSPYQQSQFARYHALLLAWNKRVNLTAVCEPSLIPQRHFLDSLTCVKVTGDLNEATLIDVGAGAGFPGVPLKIVFPGLRLTLLDSVSKKTQFLEALVAELALVETQVLTERAERLGQAAAHRSQYDWAVARAVAPMRILVEYLLPLCRVGGQAVAQKGRQALEEVAEAQKAIQLLGGGEPVVYPVQLSGRAETGYLVAVPKVTETPARFPRRVGIPAKRPL